MSGELRPPSSRRRRSAPGTPPPVVRPTVLEVRADEEGGAALVVSVGGAESVEVTRSLTAAVAHALWQLKGRPDIENWVEAERLVQGFLRGTRGTGSGSPDVVVVPRSARAAR